MKKFISVFLAVALVAVACCVFASAEDTNLALGKSYTIDGYDYDASVENYVDNETWTSAGEGTKSGEGSVAEFALTLDSAVNASYVKVEMTCGASNWVFVSEFEAFGTAGSGGTDESEAVSEAESETASSAAPAESSTAASSAGTSSTPSTSDAGIVAVVVLAVVAVIGAAVVVKKRA